MCFKAVFTLLSLSNLPIILTLRHIANLFECMAMFYFVKRLSALRIVTEPCSDRILLFGRFPVLLHHAFDVLLRLFNLREIFI